MVKLEESIIYRDYYFKCGAYISTPLYGSHYSGCAIIIHADLKGTFQLIEEQSSRI